MTLLPPSKGPRPAEPARGDANPSRRSLLELSRIYLSSSAYRPALEVLDRLVLQTWDEEAQLLRAEALLGLGRTVEADTLLGVAAIPGSGRDPRERAVTRWRADGRVQEARPQGEAAPKVEVRPQWGDRRRTGLTRKERLAYTRFLLQLRILHRTSRYEKVVELGRAFFHQVRLQPSILAARIATVTAQSLLAARQPVAARSLYEEILDLYERLRSPEGKADTLLGLANANLLGCCWDEADALYQEARFQYEEMGSAEKALACLINLGVLRAKRGDLAGGRSLLEQARSRAAQLGDTTRVASIELGLGMIATRMGDHRAARGLLLGALSRARRSVSPRSRALAFEFLGEHFLNLGRLGRARACLEAGRRIAREIAPEGDLLFEIRRRQAELALRECAKGRSPWRASWPARPRSWRGPTGTCMR
jgi:tetratricopeptide (TPR) repeat protein